MVVARAQRIVQCSPEEYLAFALDVERYAQVDDKLGPFDRVDRKPDRVEFTFRPRMPGIPGPAPKMSAQGLLTPGERIDVTLAPLPENRLWHRLMTFNASFECEVVGTGTLVTRTMSIELTPAVRWLIDPVLRRNLPGNIESETERAKAHLERRD